MKKSGYRSSLSNVAYDEDSDQMHLIMKSGLSQMVLQTTLLLNL